MDQYLSDEEYRALPSLKDANALDIAEAIHDILYEKRGRNIKVMKVENKTDIADYFVLCTGTSRTQIRGLSDEVEYKTGLRHLHPLSVEGRGNSSWVLLDYGTVVVHIFNREAREFYNLDKLYSDMVEVEMGVSDDADEPDDEI